MKNKEEPSANSQRGNPSEQVDLDRSGDVGSESTGSLKSSRRSSIRTSANRPSDSGQSVLLTESPSKSGASSAADTASQRTLICRSFSIESNMTS